MRRMSEVRRFARVVGPVPGPRSRALVERERPLLAPGIQQISTLAGVAFARGDGALLEDVDGNRYLDFVAGIGVASIGHGHPALAEALSAQAAQLAAGSFASEPRARLLERIAAQTARAGFASLARTQLYSGGAEAVESALRLARAATGKHEVIAFSGGFHGKTGGVLGLMGSDFKHGLGPFVPGQYIAPYPDSERADVQMCINTLHRVVREQTGGAIAALLVEPMQGTAGNVVPPPSFLPALAEVARELGALLIADEMITGWGRTGRMFGCEHARVEPDVLVFGKGVGGGYPVSGLITRDAVIERAPKWARPSHSSSSYGGSPLAAAAADAVTRVIVDDRLDARAADAGATLLGALRPLRERFDFVGDVRGVGLLIGVDLRVDRAGCEWIFRECLRRGLLTMAYAPRVRINPPLVITREQALEGAAIFADVLAAFAERRPA
jgi:4-aminobutyrate aminotransferase-like enzyme